MTANMRRCKPRGRWITGPPHYRRVLSSGRWPLCRIEYFLEQKKQNYMLSPEQLPSALLDHAHGLRAESLLAHVIAGGYPREGFTVGTGTFFERAYANDVTDARLQEDIHVELSRPGYYDLLPEGLFFQPAGSEYNSRMGVTEMAALHRWNKNRGNGIRKFFQPFEPPGFHHFLQLEEEERALQQGLEKGLLHRYFRVFWGCPQG